MIYTFFRRHREYLFGPTNLQFILVYSASTSSIRVTTSGNASLFHGVPDWIYEEEVLSQDYALWWSPDSSKIAFLRLDETAVEEYRFPIYNPTEDSYAVVPYTEDVVIKYPKPGYNNPLVSVHVFDLEAYLSQSESAPASAAHEAVVDLRWFDSFPSNNSIINQVAWVDDSTLVLKEVTRAADHGNVVLFNLGTTSSGGIATGEVVRKLGIDGEEGDEGWIDAVSKPLADACLGTHVIHTHRAKISTQSQKACDLAILPLTWTSCQPQMGIIILPSSTPPLPQHRVFLLPVPGRSQTVFKRWMPNGD